MEEGAIGSNSSSEMKETNSDENKQNLSDSSRENKTGNITSDDEEVHFEEISEVEKTEPIEDHENNGTDDEMKEISCSDNENVQVDDEENKERVLNSTNEGSNENNNGSKNIKDSRTVKPVSMNTEDKLYIHEASPKDEKVEENETMEEIDKVGEESVRGDDSDLDEKTIPNGHEDTEKKLEQKGKSFGSTKKRNNAKNNSDEEGVLKDKKDLDLKEEKNKNVESTARASVTDRPVRERKSVERLVVSTEREAVKEFQIEKGRGTPLKDIPNVAYKLSKRKADDTIKMLHAIFFGRRGKAFQMKHNILHFSGFVWQQDEEKNTSKVREKLDKCTKEKLFEFCEILDIQSTKATTRKEDIVTKLIDFLMSPCSTTAVLLSEKEQSSRGKKRKSTAKSMATPKKSRATKSNQHSGKSGMKSLDESKESDKNHPESETEEESKGKLEIENEIPNYKSGDLEAQGEDDKIESPSENRDHDSGMKRTPARRRKRSSTKNQPSTVSSKPKTPETVKKPLPSSDKKHEKGNDARDTNPRVFSRKKKEEKPVKEKRSSVTVIDTGKRKASSMPTDDELREKISEILKEVDFNTATFTDILKQLVCYFGLDLSQRKSSIKLMIQAELTKLAEEDEDGEDGDEDITDVEKTSVVSS